MAKRKPTALITGASGGIGYELAKLFARDDYDLILVARNSAKLNQIKKELGRDHQVKVHTISQDLSLARSATEVFKKVKRKKLKIDILVNNAGFGDFKEFSKSAWEKQEAMINLNMLTLTHLTHLVLPGMKRSKNGKILNVASLAAFMPGPYMSVYYATKAYVLSFSEALATELEGTDITVTTLCPGYTETSFQKTADLGKDAAILKNMGKPATSAEVAKYGYDAMHAGKTTVIHGFMNRLLAFLVRLAPRGLVRGIVKRISKE